VNNIKAATICLILACALTISAPATTIVVTNTNDNGPGSLRQALVDANDGDTVDATGVSGTITLTSGQFLVDKSVISLAPAPTFWLLTAMPRVASSRLLQVKRCRFPA
jgi:hypothetical protein